MLIKIIASAIFSSVHEKLQICLHSEKEIEISFETSITLANGTWWHKTYHKGVGKISDVLKIQ